jgi:hypothetical protein
MVSADLFRITVDEERHAIALARVSTASRRSTFYRERGKWVVSLKTRRTDNLVVRVLDAVRRSLAGEPLVSARVTLDGHEYHMQGE